MATWPARSRRRCAAAEAQRAGGAAGGAARTRSPARAGAPPTRRDRGGHASRPARIRARGMVRARDRVRLRVISPHISPYLLHA